MTGGTMYDRAIIKAMCPAQAFVALQGLRRKLSSTGIDAEDYDTTLGLLEGQVAQGMVINAADVMAIAQEILHQQRNDPALVNPQLLPALIAGLSVVTSTLPLHPDS